MVVGVPYGDRTTAGTEGIVGFFVDTVPVRLTAAADVDFAGLLRECRAATTFAARNRDVPYDLVDHALRRAGTPLDLTFWFNFLGPPEAAPDLGPAAVGSLVELPPVGALFDVNLYVTDHGDTLDVHVVMAGSRVDAGLAAELGLQYHRLIAAVVADPERPLGEHHLASPAEHATGRGAVAAPAGHDAVAAHPAGLPTVAELLVRHRPAAVAIRDPAGDVSYGDLVADSAALADRLRTAGTGPGDTVAILLPRGRTLVTALLAVWSAGADFCVLDPAAPLAWTLRQVDAAPAFTALLATDAPAELRTRIRVHLDPATNHAPAPSAAPSPAGDRMPGYLAFTSGTTGAPKPVRADGRPLHHFLRHYADTFALSGEDRYALLAGLGHDPLLRDVFAPLSTGGTLCVPAEHVIRSPRELGRWLAAQGVTVVHLTPPVLRLLTSREQPPLPQLRLVVCGGDQLYFADVAAIRAIARERHRRQRLRHHRDATGAGVVRRRAKGCGRRAGRGRPGEPGHRRGPAAGGRSPRPDRGHRRAGPAAGADQSARRRPGQRLRHRRPGPLPQ